MGVVFHQFAGEEENAFPTRGRTDASGKAAGLFGRYAQPRLCISHRRLSPQGVIGISIIGRSTVSHQFQRDLLSCIV